MSSSLFKKKKKQLLNRNHRRIWIQGKAKNVLCIKDGTKENNKDPIENWLYVGGLYEASPYPNQRSKWAIQFAKVVGPYVVFWLVG
jgi:hypothetical protein